MTIENFVKSRKPLFWYIADPRKLSKESIIEHVLNYGDWDDVQKMIKILGIKKVAGIFRKKSEPSKMGRQNYRPEVKYYFDLFFNKYA